MLCPKDATISAAAVKAGYSFWYQYYEASEGYHLLVVCRGASAGFEEAQVSPACADASPCKRGRLGQGWLLFSMTVQSVGKPSLSHAPWKTSGVIVTEVKADGWYLYKISRCFI